MPADDTLPEGTDHIITGSSVTEEDDAADLEAEAEALTLSGTTHGEAVAAVKESAEPIDLRAAFFDGIGRARDSANDRAREFVQAGKDRATSALDDVVRSIEDAAAEIDAKIGTQYGDFARRAAQSVGGFSDAFRDKDVDALFADGRDLLRKSPGVAIGVATAIGFVIARLARAGVTEAQATAEAKKTA